MAHFKLEEYEDAGKLYAEAVTAGGTDSERREWLEMSNLAKANHAAKINIEVPKPHYFKDDDLLGPPVVRNGDLVCSTNRSALQCCCSWLKRLRLFLGEALGALGTLVIDVAIRVVGWKYDYRAGVWTNWDRRGWLSGVLTLAYVRELLNAHNLISTYPPDELVAFQKRDQPIGPPVSRIFGPPMEAGTTLCRPKGGRRRHALPAQRRPFRRSTRNAPAIGYAQRAHNQSRATQAARRSQRPTRSARSPFPQSAGRIVDPIHDP